ncbi:MAG: hypothetical protein JG775_894 [Defluviitaleaceae bacterium]|jgi:hypothetical protein|nr:hypothetical protein [Defluviitalea raffinosedens]MBZ4667742.1 hypothetical protein [Defluviitaleaceae bacterium]
MITFPNPSFRKYSYPKNQSLRLSALNPLSPQKYVLSDYLEEYSYYFNDNLLHSSQEATTSHF